MKRNEERNTHELTVEELGDVVGAIDTVPLPDRTTAIGTWSTPERSLSLFSFGSFLSPF
jgi:hypothetical protein